MECVLDGLTVNYEVRGAGTPIVLLHGASLDHRHILHDFEPLFALHPGWLRIYPDLPGHGRTPAPPWMLNQAHVAEVVLAFIAQVIGAQRFAIGGESWGGALAQPVVQRYREQVAGACFIVTAASFEVEDDPPAPPPPLIGDPALVVQAEAIDPRAGEVVRWQPVQTPHVLDWWLENSRPAKPLLDAAFSERLWGDPEAGRLAFPHWLSRFPGRR
jgi:pimeloyl-ACP methyl ester carboxylesterase